MKKITGLFVCLFAVSVLASAQSEAPPKRPDNIGVSDFDGFKNNSFDILDESTRLKNDATRIDNEIKGGVLASMTVDKIRQDIKALRGISESSQALTQKIGDLDEQGKTLLSNAKNVNPRTKAPAATNNTNKSIKGLEVARKNLDVTASLVKTNTDLLVNELKLRGESID
ncbi:MAG: hypothetical protein HRU69_07930 [Flammeovirgaceae bacterium]|nr:MAG: hypothetical protein HRU69_07930 [Flammeovirgaceae bacterium]